MQFLFVFCVLWYCFWTVRTDEFDYKKELKALAAEIELLKTSHAADVSRLNKEIQELRQNSAVLCTDNHARNEQATLEWAERSMKELRIEMKEINRSVNNSRMLKQLQIMRNQIQRSLSQNLDLIQLYRVHEARLDKLDGEVGRLKHDAQVTRTTTAQLRTHLAKVSKELKRKQLQDLNVNRYNDVLKPHGIKAGQRKAEHKIRHNKMVHAQISRLAHTQDQMEEYQQNLQAQILDVQKRLDRVEEPNWNLVSARVDILELENNDLKEDINNITFKLSDFYKVHASMLELREDVESIENKADKTIPEFRKEISKLDVSFAKLNAQSSYLKEDQENLRQSVKAIAVSVSNTIDRAEIDRLVMKKLNDSVVDLEARSKQHYYRLNDHILKSEANKSYTNTNGDVGIPLPQLMGEVKELQPVEHEYEDLVSQLPRDCTSVIGVADTYLIRPGNTPVETWCASGTTLLQRRYNGSVEFNRKFVDYVQGFGNPTSEYWLGLESMHQLTSDKCSSVRIDMTDIYGSGWYAEYEHFTVGNSDSGYILDISGYKGNASDAFEYQNHMQFSTIDLDRDISNTHCARNYEGGWWFSHCQHVNINGKYTLGLTWFDSARNEWIAVATSEMRLFRRPGCS